MQWCVPCPQEPPKEGQEEGGEVEKMEEETAPQEAGEGEEGQVARKRTTAGRGTPSKKKRRQEEGTQLLKVLLSSPSLSVEQVQGKIAEELDSIAQV